LVRLTIRLSASSLTKEIGDDIDELALEAFDGFACSTSLKERPGRGSARRLLMRRFGR